MKVELMVENAKVVLEGDLDDVLSKAFDLSEADNFDVVSVVMTPEEQRDAFDDMVTCACLLTFVE